MGIKRLGLKRLDAYAEASVKNSSPSKKTRRTVVLGLFEIEEKRKRWVVFPLAVRKKSLAAVKTDIATYFNCQQISYWLKSVTATQSLP